MLRLPETIEFNHAETLKNLIFKFLLEIQKAPYGLKGVCILAVFCFISLELTNYALFYGSQTLNFRDRLIAILYSLGRYILLEDYSNGK